MNLFVYGVLGIIFLAIVEYLVAAILDKLLPEDSKWRHPAALVVAVLILAVVVVSLPSSFSTSSDKGAAGFLYQLTIQDGGTRAAIEGAEVVLLVPGVPAFRASTDDAGIAAFMNLPEDVIGKSATLSVQAVGYEPYRLNVAIQLNQLPELISLNRE